MKIAIIGSGIVGSATGKYFSDVLGHQVIFNDVDINKVRTLDGEEYCATTSLEGAILGTDVAYICVPTNNDTETNTKQDLQHIIEVSKNIGKILLNNHKHYAVVVKSTVLPGTTRNVVGELIERYSGRERGVGFYLDMEPEFLTFKNTSWTDKACMKKGPENADRLVFGEINSESGEVLEKVYEKVGVPKFHVSLETAEFTKYANNFLLPARTSAWNELKLLTDELREKGIMNVDTNLVAAILILDSRIGEYGSTHGKAWGGPCFKKDPKAFLKWAEKVRDMKMLQATVETNDEMKEKYGTRE